MEKNESSAHPQGGEDGERPERPTNLTIWSSVCVCVCVGGEDNSVLHVGLSDIPAFRAMLKL